jgi:uncharacterized protein (DUF4415 family)
MSLSKERLAEIAEKPDDEIDYSDIAELGDDFWQRAKLELPDNQDNITLSIDHDILTWLKSQRIEYKTAINQILRQYMNEHVQVG